MHRSWTGYRNDRGTYLIAFIRCPPALSYRHYLALESGKKPFKRILTSQKKDELLTESTSEQFQARVARVKLKINLHVATLPVARSLSRANRIVHSKSILFSKNLEQLDASFHARPFEFVFTSLISDLSNMTKKIKNFLDSKRASFLCYLALSGLDACPNKQDVA